MLISKNNYIRASGTGNDFTVTVDSLPVKFDNYYLESCKAAEEIYNLKQGKLYLMYSGGVDSEYALNVFLSMGMDVTPVIVRMNPYYNAHDFKYASDFCDSKNLKPLIIDIDLKEFVKSGKILDIARSIKSSVYHYSTTAYAIGQLDGTVICGDGEPYINNQNGVWNVTMYEFDYALVNYYKDNNIYGTPHFNRYSPEMMISFLSTNRMKELAENKHPGKLGSNSSKGIIYNEVSNFNLPIRPKYHGFELIEASEIFNHEIFKEFDKLPWTGVHHEEYYSFIKRVCVP
jgi:hypothetical protein